jgi:heme/copper-type cytochrome/quinol oxidase subunit 2
MRGWIYVHPPDEYGKWAAENLTAAAPAEEPKPAAAEPKKEGTAKK